MGLVLRLQSFSPVGVTVSSARDFGEEDRCLSGFSLSENDTILALGVRPVLKQLAGDRRDACVFAPTTPLGDIPPDVVDQAVLLATFSGGIEVEGLLDRAALSLLALPGDGDRDEGLAGPTALPDFASGALRTDLEIAVRLLYGVFRSDYRSTSSASPSPRCHGHTLVSPITSGRQTREVSQIVELQLWSAGPVAQSSVRWRCARPRVAPQWSGTAAEKSAIRTDPAGGHRSTAGPRGRAVSPLPRSERC